MTLTHLFFFFFFFYIYIYIYILQVDMEPVLAIDFNIKDILLVTFMLQIFCLDSYFRNLHCIVHCYGFLLVTLVRI
jgi:hypothetical protein